MAAERCAWVLSILLVLACSPEPDGSSSRRPPLHSVLLVTVDTLRADELGSYGRTGNPTPQMDALAARGIVFETAVAAATRTAPSHATLLTSRFPREHSIGHGNGTTRLEGITTLAERFGAEGYDTAAFVSSFILDRRIGLDRGFDVYDDELPRYEQNRPFYIERLARDTTERALRWLERPRRVPFFVWVHYQDPHGPYTPPSELVRRADRGGASDRRLPVLPGDRGRNGIPAYQRLEGLEWASEYTARYAGEIAYVDAAVGRLLSAAERAAAPRGLVILLTADHGESLGEDSFYFQHGHATTPDLALAPFVLAAPGLEPGRRREPVSHVDAMPTLLELAGFAPPADARGLSLVGYLIEGHPIPERPLFCDIGNELSLFSGGRRVHVWGALKLWGDWATGRTSAAGEPPESLLVFESFERGDDEGWREVPLDVELREQIHAYLRLGLAEVPAPELQGTDAERLRALGYVIDEPDGR